MIKFHKINLIESACATLLMCLIVQGFRGTVDCWFISLILIVIWGFGKLVGGTILF
jgi:hypothetical protein